MLRVLTTLLLILSFSCAPSYSAVRLDDEGVSQGYISNIDFVGDNVTATKVGITGTVTIGSNHVLSAPTSPTDPGTQGQYYVDIDKVYFYTGVDWRYVSLTQMTGNNIVSSTPNNIISAGGNQLIAY